MPESGSRREHGEEMPGDDVTELYDRIGRGYTARRIPDPRIDSRIRGCLEGCSSIVNVGAGTGSYEPPDRLVAAVEPSTQMIAQRVNRANVVRASAEALPFRDASVDGVMAILTIHHWRDRRRGLEECARVARKQVTLLTWDPNSEGFWLVKDYFPDILELDRANFPSLSEIRAALGNAAVEAVPIPGDCTDGFLGAYWKRPEAYLDADVRSGMSSFSCVPDIAPRLQALRSNLISGEWHRRHGALLSTDELDIGYRLVTAILE